MNTKKSAQNKVPPKPNKMNSIFYEKIRAVNTHWPQHIAVQLADVENAFEDLKDTLKSNQLKNPEIFKAYCLAALNQIDVEYKRIGQQFWDNEADKEFIQYRNYFREVLLTIFEAQQMIIEYLATYFPEIFKGSKLDLLWEYLPDTNPIRKQIHEYLTKQEGDLNQKNESRANRNEDGILKYNRENKYPVWCYVLADYLLNKVGSSKANTIVDRKSSIAMRSYFKERYDKDFYVEYKRFLKNIGPGEPSNWHIYVNSMPYKHEKNNLWKDIVLDICDNDNKVKIWLNKL